MNANQRIRQYIKDNGMTFTFVAERAGFDIKKFSRLMNNKQQMTTDEYEKICIDGLRVQPSFFYETKFLEIKNKNTA